MHTDPTKPKPDSTKVKNPYEDNPYEDNPYEDSASVASDATAQQPQASPATGFRDAMTQIGDAMHVGAQGVTLGLSDEGYGLANALLGRGYTASRDEERARLAEAHDRSPAAYRGTEFMGSLVPAAVAGPIPNTLRAMAGMGAKFGAASAFGHAEGDPLSQALQTGIGGVAGGVAGAATRGGGKLIDLGRKGINKVSTMVSDRLHPEQVVAKDLGAMLTDDALLPGNAHAVELARQNADVPGSTSVADLLPDDVGAAFARRMGASRPAAVSGMAGSAQRTAAVDTERKLVGSGFDDIAKNEILITPEMRLALIRLGAGPDEIAVPHMQFKPMQDFLSALKARTRGMERSTERHNLNENTRVVTEGIRDQIPPEYHGLWAQYGDLARRQETREGIQEAMTRGVAGQRAGSAYGANSEGMSENIAVSPQGITGRLTGWLDRNKVDHADAVENMMFRSENAHATLAAALKARGEFMQPKAPATDLSPLSALIGQATGSVQTPTPQPKSSNASEAKGLGLNAIKQGMPVAALKQQLLQQYDSATVEFVLASLPNRLPQ